MSLNPILSTAEVAALLQCSDETVEIAARECKLPGVKFGRAWVFPAAALLDALNAEASARVKAPAVPEKPQPLGIDLATKMPARVPGRARSALPVLPPLN